MKYLPLTLIFSIALHALILVLNFIAKEPKKSNLQKDNQKKISIHLKKIKKIKKAKIFFSLLGIQSEHKNLGKYKSKEIKELGIGKINLVFTKIDENLVYPPRLIENNIKGTVDAIFYLDKNGVYKEGHTQIKGISPYLRVQVAKALRKAFRFPLKVSDKRSQFKIKVHFALTTSRSKKDNSKIFENQYYFYRQAYGTTTNSDKVQKLAHKTLIHLSNWLTLLEYLPDSDKKKSQKRWHLKNYEYDPFFR